MKVLVTGSQGFIGQNLCGYLQEKGITYRGYDLVNGDDIRDKLKLDKVFEEGQFDAVIHLAALAGVRKSKEYPDEYISTNINGTYNVIEMCKKYKVDKLLFYSSSSVLGGNKYSSIGLEETELYNPQSLYAHTKVMGELMVKASGLNNIIIRPFTVYGENGRPDMVIYKWINAIKAKKEIVVYNDDTIRGYTYVGDLVKGTIDLLLTNKNIEDPGYIGNIVHLGGKDFMSIKDVLNIFTTFCELNNIDKYSVNHKERLIEDVKYSFADISKAKRLINFNPDTNFKDKLIEILNKEFNK